MATTVTVKRRPYRRKRRTTRRRPARRYNKSKSDFSYAKLKTIGMPYNMYTFMRMSTPSTYWELSAGGTYTNPYQSDNNIWFSAGLNQITPWNMQHGGTPVPFDDPSYFGPAPTPSLPDQPSPPNGLYTWSGHTWWAQWFRKMRITHVWVKYTIRPYVADTTTDNAPINVSVLESKYIANLNAPQILGALNFDDLRASKGCKTFTIAGNRTKPLVIKRKVNVQKLLGCRDLADVQFTNCTINKDLNPSSITSGLVKNPSVMQQVFGFLRVSRASAAAGGPPIASKQAFTIQVDFTCKVHFSQLNRNNPISLTGSTPLVPEGDHEDSTQGGTGSST